MIFLIFSEYGFNEVLANADDKTDRLWLNKGAVNDEALLLAQNDGWQIQVFSEMINVKSEQAIVKAIKYIEKKWPHEVIEVEYL